MLKVYHICILFIISVIIIPYAHSAESSIEYTDACMDSLLKMSNQNPHETLVLVNEKLLNVPNDSLYAKARLTRIKGLCYFYMVDYAKALDCFLESSALFGKANFGKGESKALSNVALVYSCQGLYDQSLAMDWEVLQRRLKAKDSLGLAWSYNNVAVALNDLGRDAEAMIYYFKALNIASQIKRHDNFTMYWYNIGGIHLENGQLDSAYFYFNKSLINAIKFEDKQGEVNALSYMGQWHMRQKDYAKAIEALNKSLVMAKEIAIVYEIESAAKHLHTAYWLKKDYENAYKMHVLYKQMADSADNKGVMRKIVEREENIKHEKELEMQNLQLAHRQVQRNLAYFVVFFIGLIALIVFRMYHLREKDNHRLFAQNEEIKHQKEEIETQRDRIKDLNDNKDRFLGIIAHDLRNPLGGISQLSDLMYRERTTIPEEKMTLYIKQIAESSNKAFSLLENLLQWSMVQLGRIPVSAEKVDLVEIIQDCIDLFKSNTLQKNILVTFKKLDQCFVLADEQMTRTIVRNLLGNAVKFTPQSGKIHIQIDDAESCFQGFIRDSGIGIELKDIPLLFDAGKSSRNIGNSREKGNGLGLVLCKEFAYRNCGKVWAESEFGHGSTFYFSLPKFS